MPTEQELRDWRYGQTQAERLVAGLLYLEGFGKIDPQHPLGGPDGKKDVLFESDGKRWVAASYFPPTDVSFRDIQAKFLGDLSGVSQNGCHGMAFFVNKTLSITERQALIDAALPVASEIFHLERIRAMLDSPRGCGLRLEYLRIPMSEAEQWAFWQAMNTHVMESLVESEQRLQQIDSKLDRILARTQSLEFGLAEVKSSLEGSGSRVVPQEVGPTETLTPSTLLWIHRLLTEDTRSPEEVRGRFRSVQVWVGIPGTRVTEASYIPPPPEQVPELVNDLLERWRANRSALVGASRDDTIEALARFHHEFLTIHPFLDANGRVARAIADQAAHELLGMRVSDDLISDKAAYFAALLRADEGDLTALATLFRASISRE